MEFKVSYGSGGEGDSEVLLKSLNCFEGISYHGNNMVRLCS